MHMGPVTDVSDRNAQLACQVGSIITSSLVLEDVLATVARRITEAVGVWECNLYEFYPQSATVVASACWARRMTQADRDWVGSVWNLNDRPTFTQVLLEGKTIEDYIDDPEPDAFERTMMEEWGEKAILTVPLVCDREVIGCLAVIEKRTLRRFTADDRDLVQKVSIPAAVAIHNARMFRRAIEQNRHLASLLDSSRAITSTVVLEDVLDMVGRKTAEALGSSQCVIVEYDGLRQGTVFRAFYDSSGQPWDGSMGDFFAFDDFPEDREIILGRVPVQEFLSDEQLPQASRESMEHWGEKSCLNVPLLYNEEPVGMLVLIETNRERVYTQQEIELAQALGEQAAVAIKHAKLYRLHEEQNGRLVSLLETSRAMTASLDAREVLVRVRDEVARLLAASPENVEVRVRLEDGCFAPFDSAFAEVEGRLEMAGGAADAAFGAAPPPDDESRQALAGLLPAETQDAQGAPRLIVPLVLKNEAQGYVDALGGPGRPFAHEQVELVQILANQAAVAVENARLYRTIERQAITDGLTGLCNHRYFYERLFQEFVRAQRYGAPLSLLMIDIDDFKRFNDHFGHPVGDDVLVAVAGILSGQLRRDVDLAARYGGEEFVVLLPNTPREGARIVGDRLKQHVAGSAPPPAGATATRNAAAAAASHTASGATPADGIEQARLVGERIRRDIAQAPFGGPGDAGHVTVSIGVAMFPESAGNPDELVRSADKALYLAKRRGKDRVEVFED